jgi:enamine deaminase RidA (YjgF/YER057c/UK114 family)
MAGYARAVRVGNTIHVSGTTATDRSGALVGIGDPTVQTEQIVRNIAWALDQLGSGLMDVVRTRIYVRDPEHWERVARAHGVAFAAVRPATTLVIAGLIEPEMLVEIEAEAIVGSGSDAGR